MNGVKVGNWCHAKAVKKVMGKGINFLEGGPRKVVDLTENRGFEIVNTQKKKEQSTINY